MQVGIGYDIHALKKGRPLILGGVTVPHPKGLSGHSDGDALLHAIVDAALGAMGAGDIGDHFPDTDVRTRNAASSLFVKKVRGLLKMKKLKIGHIDSTVIAEAPRLGPYKGKMREKIAAAFGIAESRVNVKAKTHEGFGELGKKRAIACFAVVSLRRGL